MFSLRITARVVGFALLLTSPRRPVSAKYSITVDKDGSNVKATFDLSVDISSTEFLASFDLNVAGKNLIDQFLPQKAFNGVKFTTLSDPSQDATVSFAITTTESAPASGTDVLEGAKRFDTVSFSS